MNVALKLARDYDIEIVFADLGDWGVDELRSEYDPAGPSIRINARIVENLAVTEVGEFITLAVGHELYHHREHIGEVERLPERAPREIAANKFARTLLEQS